MPTSSHAFFLLRTYVCESFLSPTNTTARPGALSYLALSPSTSTFNSWRMVAAVAFPSIISVVEANHDNHGWRVSHGASEREREREGKGARARGRARESSFDSVGTPCLCRRRPRHFRQPTQAFCHDKRINLRSNRDVRALIVVVARLELCRPNFERNFGREIRGLVVLQPIGCAIIMCWNVITRRIRSGSIDETAGP